MKKGKLRLRVFSNDCYGIEFNKPLYSKGDLKTLQKLLNKALSEPVKVDPSWNESEALGEEKVCECYALVHAKFQKGGLNNFCSCTCHQPTKEECYCRKPLPAREVEKEEWPWPVKYAGHTYTMSDGIMFKDNQPLHAREVHRSEGTETTHDKGLYKDCGECFYQHQVALADREDLEVKEKEQYSCYHCKTGKSLGMREDLLCPCPCHHEDKPVQKPLCYCGHPRESHNAREQEKRDGGEWVGVGGWENCYHCQCWKYKEIIL